MTSTLGKLPILYPTRQYVMQGSLLLPFLSPARLPFRHSRESLQVINK